MGKPHRLPGDYSVLPLTSHRKSSEHVQRGTCETYVAERLATSQIIAIGVKMERRGQRARIRPKRLLGDFREIRFSCLRRAIGYVSDSTDREYWKSTKWLSDLDPECIQSRQARLPHRDVEVGDSGLGPSL